MGAGYWAQDGDGLFWDVDDLDEFGIWIPDWDCNIECVNTKELERENLGIIQNTTRAPSFGI